MTRPFFHKLSEKKLKVWRGKLNYFFLKKITISIWARNVAADLTQISREKERYRDESATLGGVDLARVLGPFLQLRFLRGARETTCPSCKVHKVNSFT